jgi:hypothetical protein
MTKLVTNLNKESNVRGKYKTFWFSADMMKLMFSIRVQYPELSQAAIIHKALTTLYHTLDNNPDENTSRKIDR